MKKSKAETAETHRRIVEIAAQAFKKKGIDATGVAEIMAAAGLTHGAFYRHFASKDALVAEAAGASMDVFVQAAQAAAERGDAAFIDYLRGYLNPAFRDETLGGCPVIQMGSELARADTAIKGEIGSGLRKLLDIAGKLSGGKSDKIARDDAIFTLSSLIGAITMSRLIDDEVLSGHILEVAKERLLGLS